MTGGSRQRVGCERGSVGGCGPPGYLAPRSLTKGLERGRISANRKPMVVPVDPA